MEQAHGESKTMREKGPHSYPFDILGHCELWDFQKIRGAPQGMFPGEKKKSVTT